MSIDLSRYAHDGDLALKSVHVFSAVAEGVCPISGDRLGAHPYKPLMNARTRATRVTGYCRTCDVAYRYYITMRRDGVIVDVVSIVAPNLDGWDSYPRPGVMFVRPTVDNRLTTS